MGYDPIEYDFDERLQLSHGHSQSRDIQRILLSHIPGAIAAEEAKLAEDRNGTDWWAKLSNGHSLSIDCKVRQYDWAATHPREDDLALESWSVIEAKKVGWTRDPSKRTDYILWLWMDTGRWCLVPFRLLCKVYQDKWKEWRSKYKTRKQETPWHNRGSYHSECTFVPRREVWAEIYRHFGGADALGQD